MAGFTTRPEIRGTADAYAARFLRPAGFIALAAHAIRRLAVASPRLLGAIWELA
jgi:hypothetical protein